MKRSSLRGWCLAAGTLFTLASASVLDFYLGKAALDRVDERVGMFNRRFRAPHPYYHHDLKVWYDGAALYGPIHYTMRTNSFGFRDVSPRTISTRTSAFRILLIGDSFTEGVGVDFDSTFAGLLQEHFAATGIEVLNAGVAAYSTAIYWKKIEYLLERRRLQFDAVVLFLDPSDLDEGSEQIDSAGRVVDGPTVPDPPGPPWYEFQSWRRYSATYRAVRILWPRTPREAWTIRDEVDAAGPNVLPLADGHLTGLTALLRTHRIPLTLVVYPWAPHLRGNDRSSLQVTYWRQWAVREGVDFIELFTPFFAEADRLGTEDAIARYFIAGDIHWSADGHRLVAGSFLRRFLPAAEARAPWAPGEAP